jgi:hypothetical protein
MGWRPREGRRGGDGGPSKPLWTPRRTPGRTQWFRWRRKKWTFRLGLRLYWGRWRGFADGHLVNRLNYWGRYMWNKLSTVPTGKDLYVIKNICCFCRQNTVLYICSLSLVPSLSHSLSLIGKTPPHNYPAPQPQKAPHRRWSSQVSLFHTFPSMASSRYDELIPCG